MNIKKAMSLSLRINGVRIKVLWCAIFLASFVFLSLLGFCVPVYKKTLIAYIRAYLKSDFLQNSQSSIINEYDVYGPVDDLFSSECIRLRSDPDPWICIHPPEVDRYVSGFLKDGALWEPETIELFQSILERDPEIGVIDIGANIGRYYLVN